MLSCIETTFEQQECVAKSLNAYCKLILIWNLHHLYYLISKSASILWIYNISQAHCCFNSSHIKFQVAVTLLLFFAARLSFFMYYKTWILTVVHQIIIRQKALYTDLFNTFTVNYIYNRYSYPTTLSQHFEQRSF